MKKKIVDFLNHPYVTKTTKMCNMTLDIVSKIGQAGTNPLALAAAIGSSLDAVKQSFDVRKNDNITQYFVDKKLVEFRTSLPQILERSSLIKIEEFETFASISTGRALIGVRRDGKEFSILCDSKGDLTRRVFFSPNGGREFFMDYFANIVWSKFGHNGIELTSIKNGSSEDIGFQSLPSIPVPYVGTKDPVKFADEINHYKKKKVSHSVIFYGLPGTGKTTFIQSYAELVRARLLILGPKAFDRLGAGELELIVDVIDPDILLLDDFDKSRDKRTTFTMLPNIKRKHSNIVVAITCNDLKELGSALLRPGRGGVLTEFLPPSLQEKETLLHYYFGVNKIDVSKFDVVKLAKEISPKSTQDWVREIAQKALIYDTQEKLISFIKESNKKQQLVYDIFNIDIGEEDKSSNDYDDDDDDDDDDYDLGAHLNESFYDD